MAKLLGLCPLPGEVEIVLTKRNVVLVIVILLDGLINLSRARVFRTEVIEIKLSPFQVNRSAKFCLPEALDDLSQGAGPGFS